MEEINQLVTQCIANERMAQEKFYHFFYPSLIVLCKKFFADDHTAVETVNDGMIKVFKNLASFDPSKGELFNWIYTIVRNAALDKVKRSRIINTVEIEGSEVPQDVSPLHALEWKDIYQLLDNLAPATRIVCSLFYLEEFSIKEISRILAISDGTVKWHLSETRKKLRPALEKYYS